MSVPTVPAMGQVDWYARLYILSEWSEENIFTRLYGLKLKNFTLKTETEDGGYLLPFVDAFSDFDVQVRYDETRTDVVAISVMDPIYCSDRHVVSVKYRVATSGDAVEKQLIEENEEELAQFYWNYTLRICGKNIFTCQNRRITQPYTANA